MKRREFLSLLLAEGVFTEEEGKDLFNTQAEFRILFHTEDVSLVKKKTEEFASKLSQIQAKLQKTFAELRFRGNFSAFFMLILIGMGLVLFLLVKSPKEEEEKEGMMTETAMHLQSKGRRCHQTPHLMPGSIKLRPHRDD